MTNEADVLLVHELTKEYSDKIVARFKEITKIFVPELTDEVQVFSSFGKYGKYGEYDPLQAFATISFKFYYKKDGKPYGLWYWIPPEGEFESYIAIVTDHINIFYEAMKEKITMNEMLFTKKNETEGVIPETINPEAKIMSKPRCESIGGILKQIDELTNYCKNEVSTIDQYMFGREREGDTDRTEPRCFYEAFLKHATDMKQLCEKLTMLRECIIG